VKDVSDARKIPFDKMPDVAKGRVWTGAQGVKVGLVDELGGYDVTLAAVRKKLDLKTDDMIALDEFPAPLSPAEKVMKILKGIGVEGAMIRAALGEWGKMQALLGPVMSGMSMAGTVQARSPYLFQKF
jgi:protease-4